MAVMTTPYAAADGVAALDKSLPVPSQDTMALDLDINGHSTNHDSNLDSRPAPLDTPNQTFDSSPLADVASSTVVHGGANMDAYLSNKTMDTPPEDAPVGLQSTEEESPSSAEKDKAASTQIRSSATTMDDIQDSANSTSEPPLPTKPEEDLSPPAAPISTTDPLIDDAIESAVQDTAGTSTVLPLVDAQESDLRHTSPPTALAPEPHPEVEKSNLALSAETEVPREAELELEDTPAEPTNTDLDLTASDLPLPALNEQPSPMDAELEFSMEAELKQTPTEPMMDTEMADAPALPPLTKISREREEDNEVGPSAKRAKTDETMADAESSASLQNGERHPDTEAVTPYLEKQLISNVKNAARTAAGKNFRACVAQLWPEFAEPYAAKVPNPVDFLVIEKRIKEHQYPTMGHFYADIKLLEDNSVLFNGPNHVISIAAAQCRSALISRVKNIPPEPSVAPKAPKAAPKSTPKASTPAADSAPRGAAARRPSRSGGSAAVNSPAFALNPSTSTPVIRRDSTKAEGGRPRREIHPPKNKDLEYHSHRPKSKKYATELKFCQEVINEMKKGKYQSWMSPFMTPVDPVALGIPNYLSVIKRPMDISTVERNLALNHYSRATDFEKDMRQIATNCEIFNPKGNAVRLMGEQFQDLFNAQWAKKDQYISDHDAFAASPASSGDEDSEDEDEADEPVSAKTSELTLRLVEEQSKLISLMANKKANPSVVQMQQEMVALIEGKIAAQPAPAKKPVKKAKAPKPAKKAPAKKNAAGGPKKATAAKLKHMGTLEKEVISIGIGELPEEHAGAVLQMIQDANVEIENPAGEVELDIDIIPPNILWKIYELISEHSPETEIGVRARYAAKQSPEELARPPAKKKNKPMTKHEQERKIEELKGKVQQFERQASGSQEPVMQTVEHEDSSGDEESSDSEEE